MRDRMSLLGGVLLLFVAIASMSLFTVDQRHFRAVKPLWGGDSFRLFPFDAV